jgi:hypothetical protein
MSAREMYWRLQQAANVGLEAAQQDDAQLKADILADGRLSPGERARMLEPVERRLAERREAHEKATAARIAKATGEYEAARPEAQLARAVFDGPERADSYLRLFAGASPRQLVEFANQVVQDKDLRGAWALRRAVAGDDVPDEVRSAIHQQLDGLTAPAAQAAKAALFALRVEASKALDPTDPALLGAANEAARFGDQTLTSREARELLDIAGVPRPASSEAVAE